MAQICRVKETGSLKLPFHGTSTGNAIVRFGCMHLHSYWQSCFPKGWFMSKLRRSFCIFILKASYKKYGL
jgi:hypothetical protein